MKWSWRIGRVLGVEVFLHTTFLFFFLGIGILWLLSDPPSEPSEAILFVASVLFTAIAHETAHAIVARIFGIRTREIVLLPFAGASRLERRPTEPFHAFLIAAAGCAANLGIAAILFVWLLSAGTSVGSVVAEIANDLHRLFAKGTETAAGRGSAPVLELLEINLAFGLFNLLPAYPMDGGPALRAVISAFTNRARASRLAARAGSFVALLLVIVGILLGDVVLSLLGLFVFVSGRQESTFAAARALVEGLRVRAAMTTQYLTLATYESLEGAANLLLRSTQNDFPVVGDDGRFLGMLTRTDLLREISQRGPMGRVIDAARRGERALSPDEKLEDLLEQFSGFPQGSLPVLEEGKLVGILNAEGVQKLLMVRDVMGLP